MDPPGATQDPVLTKVDFCSTCRGRMGEFSVYEGKGVAHKAHLRGSIVQRAHVQPAVHPPPIQHSPDHPPVHHAWAPQPYVSQEVFQPSPAIAPSATPIPPGQVQQPPTQVQRAQLLAVPVSKPWEVAYKDAIADAASVKSRKSVQQEMSMLKRTTQTFVIYGAAFGSAANLELALEHFPEFQLSHLLPIMEGLDLQDSSLLDIYHGDEQWTTITPKNVIQVRPGQPIILRKRASIFKGLELSECPDITTHLSLYDRQMGKRKRPTHESNTHPIKLTKASEPPVHINDPVAINLTEELYAPFPIPFNPSPSRPSPPRTQPPTKQPSPFKPPRRLPAPHPMLGSGVASPQLVRETALFNSHAVHVFKPIGCSGKNERGEPTPRYPHDFAVCDIVDGDKELDRLKETLAIPQYRVFTTIFSGTKYRKSTANNHRRIWKQAPDVMKTRWLKRGPMMRGLWLSFVNAQKATENPDSGSDIEIIETRTSTKGKEREVYDGGATPDGESLFHFVPEDDSGLVSDEDSADHSKLCPACDELLPSTLGPELQVQLDKICRNAPLRPTAFNKYHWDVSTFTSCINFCQAHRHIIEQVPKAMANEWPLTIDFEALPSRVHAKKAVLQRYLDDPQASPFFEISRKSWAPGSSKSMAGYETFGKQGAAYYGERGFTILVRTLRSMFPQRAVDEELLKPVRWYHFIEEVLLPETAVLLIMDDKSVAYNTAREIHLESRSFGVLNHPQGDADDGDDFIIKEEPEDLAFFSSLSTQNTISGEPIMIDLTDE